MYIEIEIREKSYIKITKTYFKGTKCMLIQISQYMKCSYKSIKFYLSIYRFMLIFALTFITILMLSSVLVWVEQEHL